MAGHLSPASAWDFTASWFTPASLFLFINLVIGTIVLTSHFSSNRKPRQDNRQLARAPSLIERVKSINFSVNRYSPFDSETTTEYPQNAESVSTIPGVTCYPPPLERAPSLVERVKSINFSFHRYSPFDSETTIEYPQNAESVSTTTAEVTHPPPLERSPSLLERLRSVSFSSFYRSEPQTESDSDEVSGFEGEHHQVKRSKSEPRVGLERKQSEKMKKSASEKAAAMEDEKEKEGGENVTTRLEKTLPFGDEGVDAKADDFINRFKQQLKLQRLESLLRYRDMIKGK